MNRLPPFQLVAATALCALGGLTFARVFQLGDLLGPVAVAAVLPVALAIGLRVVAGRLRPAAAINAGYSTMAAMVVLMLVIVPVVFHLSPVPSASTFRALGRGVADGWAGILASSVPAPPRFEFLLVPVALVFLAGFLTVELALRTRLTFLLAAPALLVAVAGILFGLRASGTLAPLTAAFLVVSLALIGARSAAFNVDQRPYDRRFVDPASPAVGDPAVKRAIVRHRLLTTVPVIAVIAIGATVVAPSIPFVTTTNQVALRDYYAAPEKSQTLIDPLAQIGATTAGNPVVFTVAVNPGLAGPARWQAVVLDRYDGSQWSTTSSYSATGAVVPSTATGAIRTVLVTQQIHTVGRSTPWLPALERPIRLNAPTSAGVQADALTGALITPGSTSPLSYTVSSQVLDYQPAELQGASVGTGDDARAAVQASDTLPANLVALRDEIVGKASSSFQQLARLVAFFQNDKRVNGGKPFTVDPQAPTGFTYGHMQEFLDPKAGTRAGAPVEFAAAFAAMSRSLGFPTRLVVGYVIDGPINPGRPYDLHASDLTAWPEVKLARLGWVPFSPVPTDTSKAPLTPADQILQTEVNNAVVNSGNETPPLGPPANPNVGHKVAKSSPSRVWPAVAMLAMLALVALVVLILPSVRKRRRSRRRRGEGSPADRIIGAWHEAVDRLVESGLDDADLLTAREVTVYGRERFGDAAAAQLAEMGILVNSALYAEQPPSELPAGRAWELSDQFVAQVDGQLSRKDRLKAGLSRRPLARSSRSLPEVQPPAPAGGDGAHGATRVPATSR